MYMQQLQRTARCVACGCNHLTHTVASARYGVKHYRIVLTIDALLVH
jgi:hypothetical protein